MQHENFHIYPDSNFHVAHTGPTWVLSAPGGPHVGPIEITIRVYIETDLLALQIKIPITIKSLI